MPKSAKSLLIGSSETYSGKSAAVLGMAHQLKTKGLEITYGKPIGTCLSESQSDNLDEDVRFIAQTLNLSQEHVLPTLLTLDEGSIIRRITGGDQTNYYQQFEGYLQSSVGDLVLIEGTGTLDEGQLFGLSLRQMSQSIEAAVILVARFHSSLIVDSLMAAHQQLGEQLLGVLINDVPSTQMDVVKNQIKPFLEKQGIEVLGILPRSDVLRSVSVGELVHQLNAEVLCRVDRMDLMVQSLKIGAMNVNSALEYLRKGQNMAVVTGGDRTDIQLAALETSTQCLILTGRLSPNPTVLSRAEDLEIPILSVDLDTLTTVEIIDRAFGQVRLHEPIKVHTICKLMSEHFNVDRLLEKLGMEPVATH